MKPTTEQILSALNKLVRENKTELKAEKVELGLAQDVQKALKQSEAIIKKSKKLVQKIDKARNAYNDLWEQTKTESEEIEGRMNINYSIAQDATRAAKELGVDIKNIKGITELENIDKDLSREINLLKYPAIK